MTVAGPVGHHGEGFSHRLRETEARGVSGRRDWLEQFARLQSNEPRVLPQRNAVPSAASGAGTGTFNRAGGEFSGLRSAKRPIPHRMPVPPSLGSLTNSYFQLQREPRGTPTFCLACSRLSPGRSLGSVSRSTFTLS